MRKIILSMQMTLDGFSTGPNDEMEYLPSFTDENMWKDLHEEMWKNLDLADTVILGRRTYQIWEKYWPAAASNPQSSESDKKFSRYADEIRKIVISSTLNSVEWKNSTLYKNNLAQEIQKLKQEPGKNMIVVGGATVAQTFAKLGLIDEYLIVVHPVILGNGKLLLKDLDVRQKLKLIGTKAFASGAVELSYAKIN
ncbi:MAG: dihydrofolate reductase family protein [Candidatus Bathyarchaeia archaeon]